MSRWVRSTMMTIALAGLLLTNLATAQHSHPITVSNDPPGLNRSLLEKYLGKNVLGKQAPSPTLNDASDYFPLKPTKNVYRVNDGKSASDVTETLSKLSKSKFGATWQRVVGDDSIDYLASDSDGIRLHALHNERQKVVSAFSPPEPMMPQGIKPGYKHTEQIHVKVYSAHNINHLEYTGKLTLNFHYIGTFELQTPAGKFHAILLYSHYHGKVGPATVTNENYVFYAKDIGEVAAVERRNVSAMFIYHNNTTRGRVLKSRQAGN